MKVFIVSLLTSVVLAVAAGFLLDDAFSRSSDESFATPSARVSEGGLIGNRHFDGR